MPNPPADHRAGSQPVRPPLAPGLAAPAMMELRLALLLLGLTAGDAEPFLFMDLEDVQAPWGLLQPRASTVARNDTFAPPCVHPSLGARLASTSCWQLLA